MTYFLGTLGNEFWTKLLDFCKTLGVYVTWLEFTGTKFYFCEREGLIDLISRFVIVEIVLPKWSTCLDLLRQALSFLSVKVEFVLIGGQKIPKWFCFEQRFCYPTRLIRAKFWVYFIWKLVLLKVTLATIGILIKIYFSVL